MRVIGIRSAVLIAALVSYEVPLLRGQDRTNGPVLAGLILDTLGAPVAFAQISVIDAAARTVADEDGHFRLADLAGTSFKFAVRRVGYNPVYFDLAIPSGLTVEVRIRMRPSVRTLATVEIDEIREPLRRIGFYERMKLGHGYFITPEMLAAIKPIRASDALASTPNVMVDRRGNRTRIMGANYRCEYSLIVDRVRVGEPGSRVRTTSPDDVVSGTDLYAIEVYPANRGIPAQFLGLSHEDGCGTIVVWTKGIVPR